MLEVLAPSRGGLHVDHDALAYPQTERLGEHADGPDGAAIPAHQAPDVVGWRAHLDND
jgi:hypothetical protein